MVMTRYNINLACQLIKLKENLKYWEQDICRNYNFVHLGTMISQKGNVHVWLGCTKTWSPGIGMVTSRCTHFGTDPSLVNIGFKKGILAPFWQSLTKM